MLPLAAPHTSLFTICHFHFSHRLVSGRTNLFIPLEFFFFFSLFLYLLDVRTSPFNAIEHSVSPIHLMWIHSVSSSSSFDFLLLAFAELLFFFFSVIYVSYYWYDVCIVSSVCGVRVLCRRRCCLWFLAFTGSTVGVVSSVELFLWRIFFSSLNTFLNLGKEGQKEH